MTNKGKLLSVLGPTCTGKSDLGLFLAKELDGEIVNADSMQVYRGFDIGSAKPDEATRRSVPHHLIDVVEPDEEFNAARFKDLADAAISDISSRGRLPVVVGGTGLYLRVLFHGLFEVGSDPRVREALRKRYSEEPESLYEELLRVDPEYARRISHRDKVRVVRALEVYQVSGVTMSERQRSHSFAEKRYDVLKIGLTRDRVELYERIDRRVDEMLRRGWVEEVRRLLAAGYDEAIRPFGSIGYRQIVSYLKGAMDYGEMIEEIKRETRRYAKRQFTWFSREKDIDWYAYPEDREKIREKVTLFIRSSSRGS